MFTLSLHYLFVTYLKLFCNEKEAYELQDLVSRWTDRSFNYQNLENVEKVLDNQLYEFIESNQSESSALSFLTDYGHLEEYEKHYDNIEDDSNNTPENALEYVQEHFEDEFIEYTETDNYPMWSTLFEFRYKPSERALEAAREAGFGIITESEQYNSMLFVRGAGYSFYSAHWIPMYLGLPWVDASKYKDLEYSHI